MNNAVQSYAEVIKVLIKDEDTVYDILQDTYVRLLPDWTNFQDESELVPG